MEFDRRWLFARPRASWSSQTHMAWEGPARLWAASGRGSCARQAPLGIHWVPSDLAVNAASGGVKRARDGIQRALEKNPRGFRRSELWAENEIQLEKTPAAAAPGAWGPAEAWGSSAARRRRRAHPGRVCGSPQTHLTPRRSCGASFPGMMGDDGPWRLCLTCLMGGSAFPVDTQLPLAYCEMSQIPQGCPLPALAAVLGTLFS